MSKSEANDFTARATPVLSRRKRSPRWLVFAVSALVLLSGGLLGRWVAFRLSPQERELVGGWSRIDSFENNSIPYLLLENRDAYIGLSSRQIWKPQHFRWRVADDTLIIEPAFEWTFNDVGSALLRKFQGQEHPRGERWGIRIESPDLYWMQLLLDQGRVDEIRFRRISDKHRLRELEELALNFQGLIVD